MKVKAIGCKWLWIPVMLMLVLMAGSPVSAARWNHRQADRVRDAELLIEGGISFPHGDLGEQYVGTLKGLGAETGYEVGIRFRYFFDPVWALSPVFHYVDFGDFLGQDDIDGPFQITPSIMHYGIDLQYFMPVRRSTAMQPFLSVGAGLFRNRYRDELQSDFSFYETSINTLGFALGGGLRLGDFELSAIYNLNRFDTVRITGELKEDYNWDYFIVRAAFAFPTR